MNQKDTIAFAETLQPGDVVHFSGRKYTITDVKYGDGFAAVYTRTQENRIALFSVVELYLADKLGIKVERMHTPVRKVTYK